MRNSLLGARALGEGNHLRRNGSDKDRFVVLVKDLYFVAKARGGPDINNARERPRRNGPVLEVYDESHSGELLDLLLPFFLLWAV